MSTISEMLSGSHTRIDDMFTAHISNLMEKTAEMAGVSQSVLPSIAASQLENLQRNNTPELS